MVQNKSRMNDVILTVFHSKKIFQRNFYGLIGRCLVDRILNNFDIVPEIVQYAVDQTSTYQTIEISLKNLFAVEDCQYDIVHAALVLHHFNNDELVTALRKMYKLSRYGVVINDLHRHWFAYHAIKILTRLF